MNKKHIITLCCLLLVVSLRAQILPKEDRLLNYRIVGFSFPNEANASAGYTLQIAVGKHYSTDSFHKYLIESLPLSTNKAIVELPAFGLFYTWRVAPKGDSNELAKATLHHFGVGTTEMVDPTKARVRILHKAEDHKDAYVFFDGNKALYDMEGRPVWYFPLVDNHVSYAGQITDLKMTPQGTISFLYNDQRAYNITYSGEVLWKGEFNDIFAEDTHYHHELCRLNNGHYMVLGTERAYWKPHQPSGKGQPLYDIAFQGPDRLKPAGYDSTFPFTNIYEYDAAGKRLWTWRFADYFPKSDLYYHNSPDTGRYSFDPHPNAFYFDEKRKVIYLGSRNIHRILKIAYPSGKVLSTFGELYSEKPATGNPLFTGQHALQLDAKGNLMIYNNNIGTENGVPRVLVCQEDRKAPMGLKKLWEYTCDVSDMIAPKRILKGFTRGGNVTELSNGDIFVSMSRPYCKAFIVNKNKQMVWGALSEYLDDKKGMWVLVPQYRASIVPNRAALEKMIWNDEAR